MTNNGTFGDYNEILVGLRDTPFVTYSHRQGYFPFPDTTGAEKLIHGDPKVAMDAARECAIEVYGITEAKRKWGCLLPIDLIRELIVETGHPVIVFGSTVIHGIINEKDMDPDESDIDIAISPQTRVCLEKKGHNFRQARSAPYLSICNIPFHYQASDGQGVQTELHQFGFSTLEIGDPLQAFLAHAPTSIDSVHLVFRSTKGNPPEDIEAFLSDPYGIQVQALPCWYSFATSLNIAHNPYQIGCRAITNAFRYLEFRHGASALSHMPKEYVESYYWVLRHMREYVTNTLMSEISSKTDLQLALFKRYSQEHKLASLLTELLHFSEYVERLKG